MPWKIVLTCKSELKFGQIVHREIFRVFDPVAEHLDEAHSVKIVTIFGDDDVLNVFADSGETTSSFFDADFFSVALDWVTTSVCERAILHDKGSPKAWGVKYIIPVPTNLSTVPPVGPVEVEEYILKNDVWSACPHGALYLMLLVMIFVCAVLQWQTWKDI